MGLARTGSFASNGSGDYVIAFTTDPALRVLRQGAAPVPEARLRLFRLRNLCGFLENTMYSRQSGRRPATCFVGITGQVFDL